MMNTDYRKSFGIVRRKYFKENKKECLKCGRHKRSVHLHHKRALSDGGDNSFENLIPLCFVCHEQWHRFCEASMSHDEFLEFPTLEELHVFYKMVKNTPDKANGIEDVFGVFEKVRIAMWDFRNSEDYQIKED